MTALIETVRLKDGRAPLWAFHQERMARSCLELGLPRPILDAPRGGPDRVVQFIVVVGEQRANPEEPAGIKERPVGSTAPVRLILSKEVHRRYPHKTTDRAQFERAADRARADGADDAVLPTAEGYVAEASIWTLFWWEGDRVATPALDLGVLPGVGRARLGKLAGGLVEKRVKAAELTGKSLFLANAARGVVQVATWQGARVESDTRTGWLAEAFWP
jgi:branched-subunit amino acid aminotransferase/4-amino-4-deoxychorismate lyase